MNFTNNSDGAKISKEEIDRKLKKVDDLIDKVSDDITGMVNSYAISLYRIGDDPQIPARLLASFLNVTEGLKVCDHRISIESDGTIKGFDESSYRGRFNLFVDDHFDQEHYESIGKYLRDIWDEIRGAAYLSVDEPFHLKKYIEEELDRIYARDL